MSKVLLDTHIWLWFISGDSRLPKSLTKIILDPNITSLISAISIWEAFMLSEKKRIILTPNPEKWLNKAREIFPVDEVPITSTIVVKSRTLKFKHNDPADRFIAATAQSYDIPLLTCDKRLKALKWLNTK